MVSNVEQWVALDDEAINDTGTYQDKLDAIIFGKNSYQPLVEYWMKQRPLRVQPPNASLLSN
jgi:hypothetical protein